MSKDGRRQNLDATNGNPIDDVAATARVDFVMRADTVYRRPDDSGEA